MDNSELRGATGGEPTRIEPAKVFLTQTALLRKVTAGLGLSGGDADDVLQSVSVKCLEHAAAFADRHQCRRWLIRVTTNECITKHRRALSFRKHAAGIAEHRSRRAVKGPAENAIATEQIDAMQTALRDLDETLLRPLVLKYFCDLSSAEIGEVLEMPASTVRGALRQGRMALARALMKRGIER